MNEDLASDPETGKTRRQVSYFLAEAVGKPNLVLEKKSGLDNAQWFPLSEVPELHMYDDMIPIITKAIKILLKR